MEGGGPGGGGKGRGHGDESWPIGEDLMSMCMDMDIHAYEGYT